MRFISEAEVLLGKKICMSLKGKTKLASGTVTEDLYVLVLIRV